MALPLPAAKPAEPASGPETWEPDEAPQRPARSVAPRRSRRALRRIAAAVVVALLVAAGASISLGWRTPAEAWTGIRSHSFSGTWTAIRAHSFSDIWAGIRRHASAAWVAVRRHTSFDEPDAEARASLAPSPGGVREATAIARGTHRRTKTHSSKRRGD